MTEKQQKFLALSKLSKEKGLPEGWVYVGFGRVGEEGLGFGRNLKDIRYPGCVSFKGNVSYWEYACPVAVWEETLNLKYMQTPERFYVNVGESVILSEAVQKYAGELGYSWPLQSKIPLALSQDCVILSFSEEKKIHMWNESGPNSLWTGFVQISLEEFFSLPLEQRLEIPRGLIPGYEVVVTKDFIETAGQKIKIVDWKTLHAQIEKHLAASIKKVEGELFLDTPNQFIAEAAQKYAFSLGYKWAHGTNETLATLPNLIIGENDNRLYWNSNGFSARHTKITLEEFFKLEAAILTIPAGLVPDYQIIVNSEFVTIGCQKISISNWKELAKKINDFLAEK